MHVTPTVHCLIESAQVKAGAGGFTQVMAAAGGFTADDEAADDEAAVGVAVAVAAVAAVGSRDGRASVMAAAGGNSQTLMSQMRSLVHSASVLKCFSRTDPT